MYKINIEGLCQHLDLGEVSEEFLFNKGMTNRTYYVKTNKNELVIKALSASNVSSAYNRNKLIMGEKIGRISNRYGICGINASEINGTILHYFEEQYYLIFNYLKGIEKKLNEISVSDVINAGNILGKMHNIKFKKHLSLITRIPSYHYGRNVDGKVDWNYYVNEILSKPKQPKWLSLLFSNILIIENLYETSRLHFKNFRSKNKVISHCDVFNQNIIWFDNQPFLIDWEKCGEIDATFDFLNTAIRWSLYINKIGALSMDKDKLKIFTSTYLQHKKVNIKRLRTNFEIIKYRRLYYLYTALNRYINPSDLVDKKRASRKIKVSLNYLTIFIEMDNYLQELIDFIKMEKDRYKRSK